MTERLIGETGSKKRRRFLLLPILLVTCTALLYIAGAQAVHDDGFFELDRNATSEAAAGEDWDLVFAGTDTASASSFVHDGEGPTIFTGGGSKDDLDTTSWQHKSGSTPPKDELLDGFAARYGDILYFGADRIANNGDAVMGFWFFQNDVQPVAGGTFGPGQHEDGDILVLSDFSGGGAVVTIRVFQWNGPGGTIAGSGAINGTLDLIAGTTETPADCVGPPSVPAGDNFCATVNTAVTPSPWPFAPKSAPAGSFQPGEFYEGGIDLSFLNLENECFASFLAETRSSTSVDATLKDFVGGSFEPCTSTLTTTPSDADGDPVSAIELGDDIYDHALIEGTGSDDNPTGTVEFTICAPDELNDASPTDDPNTCDVGGTAVSTNPVTPVADSSNSEALSDAFTPDATGTWCWRGHYSGDGNYPAADDATTGECFNVVDAQIDVSPLNATNEVGSTHTITATVQQDTGSGFASAPDGTGVTFSLANNNAGAVFTGNPAVSTCTTTGGTCSVSITTSTTGTVDIHATTTFTVGGVSVTRATGSGGNNSADAKKRFVDAQIDLSPLDDTNGITENHVITATVQQDDGLAANTGGGDAAAGFGPAPNGTTVTFNIVSGTATFVPAGTNTCTTTAGTCTVTITSSTAGTVVIHATTTFNIGPAPVEEVTRATGTGGLNSADAQKVFVAGSLIWFKDDNAGNPLGGATFEVCRTLDRFGDPVTGECVSVADNSTADTDKDDGQFKLENLKLGHYTVEETAAPPGYAAGGGTKSADLTIAAPDATISVHFVNNRPIVKITGFGYTNAATGTPTAGVVSGTATYTVNLHNYGGAAASITNSSIVASVTGAGAGTLTCDGDGAAPALSKAISGPIAAGGNLGPVTLVCTYSGMTDGAVITATLNIKYTLNSLERLASGSPATISFTVQGD